jgi:uncharacterized protein with NAD-binding domain and iron-sulfur cluster
MASSPQKIAILGGGVGAISAAFALTEAPEWAQRYEITVYQQGWRLGGKGASGRRATAGQRIEEHGLHVWAGFYENAFRLLRRCYEVLQRPPTAPLANWRQAFRPHSFITVEEYLDGQWLHWNVTLPTCPGLPGDGGPLPSPWGYALRLLHWLQDLFLQQQAQLAAAATAAAASPQTRQAAVTLNQVLDDLPVLQRAWQMASSLPPTPFLHPPRSHRLLGQTAAEFLGRFRSRAAPHLSSPFLRRLWLLAEVAIAAFRGILADGILFQGFDSIDHWDWADWLRRHGAAEAALQSPVVRAVYDYVFGYREGDPSRPALAAGTCLRGLLRLLFTAKGAIFWEMQAGMGDVVFAPLYQVLCRRGVRFQFFHRIRRLELSADQQSIERIHYWRQATPRDPQQGYQPLVSVRGLDCWPAEPLYEQLQEGQQLQNENINLESAACDWHVAEGVLERGRDFDQVILGISLGALRELCAELIAARPAWRQFVDQVQTVRTAALQLWLHPTTRQLGWTYPATILTAYAQPFNTWGDLSHLVSREDWPAPQQPGSIAYFCGPLPDESVGGPAAACATSYVQTRAEFWLRHHAAHLWPQAVTPSGEFNWDLLVDLQNRQGVQRLAAQYFRANVDPSERYVLSLPGTTCYRLRADQSGFTNLYLAGDWVRTGINAGCVEAAVMAGFQAARALSGYPQDIPGEGDQVPAPLPPEEPAASAGLAFWWQRLRDWWLVLCRWLAPVRRPARTLTYIEVGGEQAFRPPLRLQQVSFFSFWLPAAPAALHALCQRRLTAVAPAGLEYHPLLPGVLLGFAYIGRASGAAPPESNQGWLPEIDVAFWVLVAAVRRRGAFAQVERLAWFLPYVYVDSAWALVTGREVYGFAKQLGRFTPQVAPDPTALQHLQVETLILDPYSPDSQAQWRPVLEVHRERNGTAPPQGQALAWPDWLRELKELAGGGPALPLPGLGLLVEVERFLSQQEVPFVFLKQFRSAAGGAQACYQALVEARARLERLETLERLPGDFLMTVHSYASQPLSRELGLDCRPCRVRTAWHSRFDFVMETGQEYPLG